jgi:hypothetical protein
VRYVDAGYVIALVVLALYALSLIARRRRVERAAARGGTGQSVAAVDVTARGVTRGHDTVRGDDASTRDTGR